MIQGVIDLVFRERNRWVVADCKTGGGDDAGVTARVGEYRAQVHLDAAC